MSKQVKIDPQKCIGCNTCPRIDGETFKFNDALGKAEVAKQPETISDTIQSAVSSCPVGAISIEENN